MTRVCRTEHTPEPSGTTRRKTSNTQLQTVQREAGRRESTSRRVGGGGGGGDLIVNVNYLDRIRSF